MDRMVDNGLVISHQIYLPFSRNSFCGPDTKRKQWAGVWTLRPQRTNSLPFPCSSVLGSVVSYQRDSALSPHP